MSLFLSSETDESMVTCETGDYVYSDISHNIECPLVYQLKRCHKLRPYVVSLFVGPSKRSKVFCSISPWLLRGNTR